MKMIFWMNKYKPLRTSPGLANFLIRNEVTPTFDSHQDMDLAKTLMSKKQKKVGWVSNWSDMREKVFMKYSANNNKTDE